MLINFKLTGLTPLLIHADDVEATDSISAWRKSHENREISKAGDDRSPAWTWITYLYTDGKQLVIPADVVSAALRSAAVEIKTGKGNKNYKALSQSGMLIVQPTMPLLVNGDPISFAPIEALLEDNHFENHKTLARELGFELFVKRAKVNQSKHVRVRARIENWSLEGQVKVISPNIPFEVVVQMFDIAGPTKGMLDWRPSSPKSPGPFGCFSSEVSKA